MGINIAQDKPALTCILNKFLRIYMNPINRALLILSVAALPVWADGYFVPSDYTRHYMQDMPNSMWPSHVMKAVDEYYQQYHSGQPIAPYREKIIEAVKKYPNELNDFAYDHGVYSPLGVAVRLNDYELVDFLIRQGIVPVFDYYSEMEKLLAPNSKVDPRIVEMVRRALDWKKLQEACVKSRLLPDINPWSYTSLYSYERPLPELVDQKKSFSRVPDPAEWMINDEKLDNILVLEGLREAKEKRADGNNVSFVRMGLGLSQDGKCMTVQLLTLRGGTPEYRVMRHHISLVPYVFTIPRKDGGTSIITFSRESKQVCHTVLAKDGQVARTELLYPRPHKGTEYKYTEDGHTTTEGFELPEHDYLMEPEAMPD